MSASQARLMSLTSRLSDLELKAQVISNSKIRLADASSEASKSYNLALNKETLTVFSGVDNNGKSIYADASINNIMNANASATDKYRYIETSTGKAIVNNAIVSKYANGTVDRNTFISSFGVSTTDPNTQSYQYYSKIFDKMATGQSYTPTSDQQGDPDWLNSQVQAGNLYLYEWDSDEDRKLADGTVVDGNFKGVSWTSGDSTLISESDDHDVAKAEAEYESTMNEIQSKDKRFDLELKTIDTEHNAIQTEMDSVKKVIDKNIERTFKIFDA